MNVYAKWRVYNMYTFLCGEQCHLISICEYNELYGSNYSTTAIA